MRLDQILPGAAGEAARTVEITDLCYDNRQVSPGALFFCVPGFLRDGHDFAPDAVARGAAALVVEHPLQLGVPELVVPSVRGAMAPAAAAFYGDPTARLAVVGVTGTNGKTTSAFLIRALLEADGRPTGLLGTVKSVIGGAEHEVARTTPEAIDLQRTFRQMLDGGDRACAMEVSSHALTLRRADAIHFAVALFTNLTQDHLDFHETMEEYFAAKRALFVRLTPTAAVINVDDPYGARLAGELDAPITFALHTEADYRALDVRTELAGSWLGGGGGGGRRAAERGGIRAALAAARRVQRRQRARRAGRRPGAGGRRRHLRVRDRHRRPGAGAVRDRRRGPAVRGRRGLRAHSRFARERAPGGAAARRGPGARRVRLRR
jgi:UDP-N-acetylmuramoyl-L-alanyl-D-glutamate--2,6-diaminopimelate ligase